MHTPGPWVTGNVDPLSFGRKRGNGTEPIGFVYGPSYAEYSEHGQSALANARLIAAAPELLEALQLFAGDNSTHTEVERMAAAHAAIKKARGEA